MNKVNKSLRFAVPSPLEAASWPVSQGAVAIRFVASLGCGSSYLDTHAGDCDKKRNFATLAPVFRRGSFLAWSLSGAHKWLAGADKRWLRSNNPDPEAAQMDGRRKS
jgi:hypothetical protein